MERYNPGEQENLVLKKNNSIVRAIVPVSTFGKKLEFNKLVRFSEKYNLKILFDTAACHDPKIFNFPKNKYFTTPIQKDYLDLVDLNKVDEVITISTEEAEQRTKQLALDNGLLVGITDGTKI